MQVAFSTFNIAPSEFWRMTMREFNAYVDAWYAKHPEAKAKATAKPMTRNRLNELMAMYPDKPKANT